MSRTGDLGDNRDWRESCRTDSLRIGTVFVSSWTQVKGVSDDCNLQPTKCGLAAISSAERDARTVQILGSYLGSDTLPAFQYVGGRHDGDCSQG